MFAVYIVGIAGMPRTEKSYIPILQCFTCDDEQASNTKSLTLHLRELILTTEQGCRKFHMILTTITR